MHKAGVVKAAAVAKQRNKKKKTWQLEDAFGSQEIQLVSQMNDFSHAPCLHKPSSAVGHDHGTGFFSAALLLGQAVPGERHAVLCPPGRGRWRWRWPGLMGVPLSSSQLSKDEKRGKTVV